MEKLINAAISARDDAYVPYSGFKVGAAVLTGNGDIYQGCNIENASYGLTNCAERTAIFKAVSEGQTNLKAIAVAADTEKPVAPCGACRQVIAEFKINKIIMCNLKGEKREVSLEELLPFSFSNTDLIGVEKK
ncbi:MAG: cytidine deaminase [Veillonellaceae bacterium]|jgi:cytidine deaminase|nr:cytidine deaminase [Veillonellaceae bacterium]